jgi:hypothetical protein
MEASGKVVMALSVLGELLTDVPPSWDDNCCGDTVAVKASAVVNIQISATTTDDVRIRFFIDVIYYGMR